MQEPLARRRRSTPSRRATTRPATATSTSRGSAPGPSTRRGSSPATAGGRRARRPRRAPGWQSSSTTSMSQPSAGPPSEHGEIASTTCGARKQPDLGAAADVDHRAAPAADPLEVPAPRPLVPRLAGRREHPQRREVVRGHVLVALRHQRAHERRRDAEDRDAVALDHRPEPVRARGSRARRRSRTSWRPRRASRRSATGPMIQPRSVSQKRTSSGWQSAWNPTSSAILARKPPCTCTAPFGRPVVPLVYATKSGCSESTGAGRERLVGPERASSSASVRSRPGGHRQVVAPDRGARPRRSRPTATAATAASAVSFIGDELARAGSCRPR